MKQNENDFIEEEDSISSESSDINDQKDNIYDKNNEPRVIIEKILICIYNQNIKSDDSKKSDLDINLCQNNIKNLCAKYDYCYIVLLLLKNIRKLINKYREIMFELPSINELYQKSKDLERQENSLNDSTQVENNDNNENYTKIEEEDSVLKTLFIELYNIKKCLKKSSPIIDKIFEIPLSKFETFSIEQCQLEEYFNILIKDKFISSEINKNKDPKLHNLLNELNEDNYSDTKLMTKKLDLFNIMNKSRKRYEKLLTISEIGSSIDEKYPEDCEPIGEIRYNNINNFINADDINSNYFLADDGDDYNLDFDIIKDSNFGDINMINFGNNINNLDEGEDEPNEKDLDKTSEIINQIKKRGLNDYSEIKMEKIIKTKKVNGINHINEDEPNKLLEGNLFIKNSVSDNKEQSEKDCNFNSKQNITNLIAQNKNNDNWNTKKCFSSKLNNEKIVRDKEPILFKNLKNSNTKNKKENNTNKFANNNKNLRIDKKEIPSDIDDLVKYIVNDDKKDTQIKKKKKNKKKTKKKNKTESETNKDKEETNINIEGKKEKENDDEDEELKQNLISNSINRFNIHKIKFKYRPQWLEKISKYT